MNVLLMAVALAAPAAGPAVSPTVVGRSYVVGEDWGCARVTADRKLVWQCWQAAPSVQAWRVPWLDAAWMTAGPDRICSVEAEAVRCIQPPRRGDRAARPIEPPAPRRALDAAGAAADGDSFYDKSYLFEGLVGGTFACPSRRNDIWCAGDNSFGQLGYAGAPVAHPPPLRLWVVENAGLGTWHGCAWRSGELPAQAGLYCWGRGDGGQLGVAAPDICKVGGKDVACARKPVRVPVDFRLPGLGYAPNRGRGDLRAGDMFTCARPPRATVAPPGGRPGGGIVCWGASRDGFFGSPALCPPGLSAAWPTRRGGSVAAPAAACSPTPVEIAGSDRFKRSELPTQGGRPASPPQITSNFDIGPRGICMVSETGEIWCKGAIATPHGLAAANVSVSPGENATACAATRKGQLYCWGEGYSPADAPDRPIAITFEPPPAPPPNPNPVPIDAPPRAHPWGQSCAIHYPCERVARSIPACPAGTKAITPEAAVERPEGETVSVRGPLRTGTVWRTAMGCTEVDPETKKPLPVQACCNSASAKIVVGAGKGIVLGGIGCAGDESRLCCDAPVRDQTVIVTGTLRRNQDLIPSGPTHRLDDAKVCSVSAINAARDAGAD